MRCSLLCVDVQSLVETMTTYPVDVLSIVVGALAYKPLPIPGHGNINGDEDSANWPVGVAVDPTEMERVR